MATAPITTKNVSIAFEAFIAALSKQISVSLDPEPGVVMIEFDGIRFMLAHDPGQWGESSLMVACDFGEVPQDNRVAVLEALLIANREMHGVWSPVFSLDPTSGHAMSMLAVPLDGFDTVQALQTLTRHVEAVQRWRRDRFLEPIAA